MTSARWQYMWLLTPVPIITGYYPQIRHLVKISESAGEAEVPCGTQKLKKTTLEGYRSCFTLIALTVPQASTAPHQRDPGPTVSPVEKDSLGWKSSFLHILGHFLGGLLRYCFMGITGEIIQRRRRVVRLTATSVWIPVVHIPVGGTQTEIPTRGSAHLQSRASVPIWLGSLVSSSA